MQQNERTKAMHHFVKIKRRSVNSEDSLIRKARAKDGQEAAEEHQKNALHIFKKVRTKDYL